MCTLNRRSESSMPVPHSTSPQRRTRDPSAQTILRLPSPKLHRYCERNETINRQRDVLGIAASMFVCTRATWVRRVILQGGPRHSFTRAIETPEFVRLSRLSMRRVAHIDGEVHRLVEFERSGPTCSIELLDTLVRPYSTISACGIRDSSGNNL